MNKESKADATKEFVKEEIKSVELRIEQMKSRIIKAIIRTSIIQFLAIVVSVIAFIFFM